MESNRENLRTALWVAIALLVAAVIPVWPYGLYTLLRLAVTGVALFALYVLGTGEPKQTIGLAGVALLFNPVIPVELSRTLWFPINLGVAYWFWTIIDKEQADEASKSKDPVSPVG